MTETAEAPMVGHNSKAVLELIEDEPGAIYDSPALLDDLLAEIDRAIEEHPIDLSTDRGRKAIASLAASISRRKSSIEDAGLARTEDWRKKTAAVNALKRRAGDELSARRDKARKPLSDWEAEEKARGERIVSQIEIIEAAGIIEATLTVEKIDARLAHLATIEITEEAFGEYAARAQAAWRRSHAALTDARPMIEQREKEQAELAELRREREARQAEDARKAAEEAKEREIEAARAEAAEKAAAVERARREHEEALAKAEADRRSRDYAHREKVRGEAHAALQETGLGPKQATKVLDAIIAGAIPHIEIKF